MSRKLEDRFRTVDNLRARLARAEANLKADVRKFSQARGYRVTLRPEQVRNML